MITPGIPYSALRDFLKGVHLAAHTYKIALYTSAAALDRSTTAYTVTNEVVGTGYVAGGQALTGYAGTADGGGGLLDFNDPAWAASTITARGAMIYNTSAGGNLAIAIIDFGADKSSSAGTFTVVMPTPDSANAIIRLN